MISRDKLVNVAELAVGSETKNVPAVLLSAEEKLQKTGGTYLDIRILDGFGKVDLKMFNSSRTTLDSKCVRVGEVVDMDIRIQQFRNDKSAVVDDLRPTSTSAVPRDFVVSAPIDIDETFEKIISYLDSISRSNPGDRYAPISDLARELLIENKEAFKFSGAAKAMHHELIGGLVYHTYRMLQTASRICSVYPRLDSVLLCSAVAIHDIAKIREMDTSELGDITYTIPGQLMGHLYMGAEMVHDFASANPGKYDPEKVMLLQHMILSHHLNPEWGAVKGPATAEAQMLHYIDQIDAKMYMYENHFEDLKPGEITDKLPYGLENNVYKPL